MILVSTVLQSAVYKLICCPEGSLIPHSLFLTDFIWDILIIVVTCPISFNCPTVSFNFSFCASVDPVKAHINPRYVFWLESWFTPLNCTSKSPGELLKSYQPGACSQRFRFNWSGCRTTSVAQAQGAPFIENIFISRAPRLPRAQVCCVLCEWCLLYLCKLGTLKRAHEHTCF